MTTASQIITRAYRESQLVAIVSAPSSAEQTEALDLLNPILLSSVGFEAGEELRDVHIGGDFDDSATCADWIPSNRRLILNLSSAKTLKLHPRPYEGQRLAVADAASNLATYNLTLDGNGRQIEGASELVLSTSGTSRQWMYRADTANWVKITSLASSDTMPFPTEYDDYFVIRLAMRLNPRNGVALSQESVAYLQRIEQALQARYRNPRPLQDMGTLSLLGSRRYGSSNSGFATGSTR